MKNKIKVSIGIPAYNEEKNILHLLGSLCSQKEKSISIVEILVYTDGSTDYTEKLVKTIKDPRVRLKSGRIRVGQQERQNQILRDFKGEVIVILEADILPADENTIQELVKPFNNKDIDMVVGVPQIVKPKGFYEKILEHGYEMKFRVFSQWKRGINVYACGGHSMKALSRNFSKKINWPSSVPEDAYTYLFLKKNGYKLYRQKSAKAYMRNVTNIRDRLRQVGKFRTGRTALSNYFSSEFINGEYSIPKSLVLKNVFMELLNKPFLTLCYLVELTLNRFLTISSKSFNELYHPYESSKELITQGAIK